MPLGFSQSAREYLRFSGLLVQFHGSSRDQHGKFSLLVDRLEIFMGSWRKKKALCGPQERSLLKRMCEKLTNFPSTFINVEQEFLEERVGNEIHTLY